MFIKVMMGRVTDGETGMQLSHTGFEESLIEICVYIFPPYWRQGLGAELLALGVSEIRKQSFKKAELWVLEENHRARRFYEKLGFRHDGAERIIQFGSELRVLRHIMEL
ncbi:MAG: GNAT family N-acetyltransferase [Bacilli bacterium]